MQLDIHFQETELEELESPILKLKPGVEVEKEIRGALSDETSPSFFRMIGSDVQFSGKKRQLWQVRGVFSLVEVLL